MRQYQYSVISAVFAVLWQSGGRNVCFASLCINVYKITDSETDQEVFFNAAAWLWNGQLYKLLKFLQYK